MGSKQSSANGGQSFSIDPSGNITRRAAATDSLGPAPEDQRAEQQQQQQQSAQQVDSQPAVAAQPTRQQAVPTGQLSLAEAEALVEEVRARHKPDWLAAQQGGAAQELEAKIVQCYRSNKNQTMNCSAVCSSYQEYVVQQRKQLLDQSLHRQKVVPLMASVLVVLACLLFHMSAVTCLGAMSVDLGSEWMKVGLVAPSVQMDIVLNAQSQRKTPMAIAFSAGERFIGEPALDVAGKYPERVYTHFIDLLGKESVDHESVQHYRARFPYAKISNPPPADNSNHSTSKSILLNHPEGLEFTPLELVAMMLQHAHDQVSNILKSNDQATDVVITVPPFFNSRERSMIEQAAKLVGLNVLRLTNSNSAFALSYGIFRHHEYLPKTSDNKTTILFFDQGASHTSATLADYHLVEQQAASPAGANETLPTITIRAQVYDRYMGGFDMQLKLRDSLLTNFCKANKIDEAQVRNRGKSISKLLKEAGRVKKILSANTDHTVRVENVINDIDLKQFITRQEFEDLNREYLEDRIGKLIDRLFEMPNVSRDEALESVIIVGGNTRTPKIQQTLLSYFKLPALGKSINGDEGAAMAALYQAASQGRGFRVKKFVLEEFNDTASDSLQPVDAAVLDPELFEASRSKLAKLREQDQIRLQRLSLKNALESIIGEAREKLSAENLDENLKEIKNELESLVKEASVWLEEGPVEETNNITALSDKLESIQKLLHPPPPLSAFDPSFLNLKKEQLELLKNKTMGIINNLNLPNPFLPSENETVTPEDVNIEPPETKGDPKGSTAAPPTVIPSPNGTSDAGPPPHTEL